MANLNKNADVLLSVVIVNYNVKDFLAQSLESIRRSSNGIALEIIVIDNNSSDGSMEFLQPRFPEIEFIALNANIGFGKANNIGIDKAAGQYILLLNPDTILADDTLHAMISFMDKHTNAGIAGCKVLNKNGTFQSACRRGFPTPWNSLCKLFGLQSIFPESRIFAGYNQSYKSIDETYIVDAVSGAFMFCRSEIFRQIHGFDPDFFMYGEDLDLCYRSKEAGWDTYYFHETSIIHFKGESSKRSSINEINVFYNAMEIFAKKHYGKYAALLSILKTGIWLRALVAYMVKYRRSIATIATDLLIVNACLTVATYLRSGNVFGLPYFAYPIVYIVLSFTVILSMVVVGEYFEGRSSVRKSGIGYVLTFFLLSSLTYYFKDYAFSRGILLATITLSMFSSIAVRMLVVLYNKISGKDADKNVIVVGLNPQTENIVQRLVSANTLKVHIVGLVSTQKFTGIEYIGFPILGNVEYLQRIVKEKHVQEVIISDSSFDNTKIIALARELADSDIRLHAAQNYDDIVISRIINDVAGVEPSVTLYPLSLFRNRVIKRVVDASTAVFLLTVGLPFVYLFAIDAKQARRKLILILRGKLSIVGIYSQSGHSLPFTKSGVTGFAHLNKSSQLSEHAIVALNEYYAEHWSLSLDIDILLKYFLRRKSGY